MLNRLNLGNLIYGLNVVKALAQQNTFTVKTKDKTLRRCLFCYYN